MPLGILIAALALSAIGTGAGIWSNSLARRQQQDFFDKDMQNQMDLMEMQNEYNSIPNQVQQMRDGGLNPDHQSVSFTPSAGASLPSAMNLDSGNLLGDLVNGIGGFVSQSLQLLQQDKQMHLTDIQIDSSMSDAISKEDSYLAAYISRNFPEELLKGIDEVGSDSYSNIQDWFSGLVSDSSFNASALMSQGFTRSQAKRMSKRILDISKSPDMQKQLLNTYKDIYGARQGYDMQRSSPYSRTSGDPVPDAVRQLMALTADKVRSELSRQTSENDYQSDLYDSMDPMLQSGAVQSGYRQQIRQDTVMSISYDICNELLQSDNEVARYFGVTLFSGLMNGSNPIADMISSFVELGDTALDALTSWKELFSFGKRKK